MREHKKRVLNMDDVVEYLLAPTTQIALIIGIAEVIKKMGVNPKYIPLLDLVLGLISGFLVYYEDLGLTKSLMIGLMFGLSACGLFSGYKNLTKG